MMTQSTSQPAAASRGGGTGGQAGSGGGRTRGRSGDQDNGRIDVRVTKVEVRGLVGIKTVMPSMTISGVMLEMPLKEFLACNPKEYDGEGCAIVYTRWIENIESVHDMSGCRDSQRLKYTTSSFLVRLSRGGILRFAHGVERPLFHVLARLVPHLVTPQGNKIERNGSIKKNPKKRGNGREPNKDRNRREDNKMTRIGNAFATTENPVRGGYTGTAPKDCRMVPRNVNPINTSTLVARTCYECGSTDNIKSACPRAFMLGAKEARQDPNIVTGK
uniref:Reverse transcriptase domain-containing protein n=1 Tax=Tanacetum cinerariifolium TaxID=118510 RepID=A0A6L2M1D6_TANCI|nr:hypothetical protein [Tanacetum cinerariifolium]